MIWQGSYCSGLEKEGRGGGGSKSSRGSVLSIEPLSVSMSSDRAPSSSRFLLGPVAGKAPRELRVAGPCGKTLVFVLPNFRAQDRPKRSDSQWFDPFARSS